MGKGERERERERETISLLMRKTLRNPFKSIYMSRIKIFQPNCVKTCSRKALHLINLLSAPELH